MDFLQSKVRGYDVKHFELGWKQGRYGHGSHGPHGGVLDTGLPRQYSRL